MPYLLDANVIISVLRDPAGAVALRLKAQAPAEVAVPAIVMHELYFGAAKSARPQQNTATVDALQFQVLEFDQEDARQAGEIRARLSQDGQSIGPYDVLIAGQARARGLTLVTDNLKEFSRVAGLATENWAR